MNMKSGTFFGGLGIAILFLATSAMAQSTTTTRNIGRLDNMWSFDDMAIGALPSNWQQGEQSKASEPPIWQIVASDDALGSNQVLEMSTPSDGGLFGLFGRTFNIIWNDEIRFKDGEIDVAFKAISGKTDQGGGIMWRVQDQNNYYLARFNPLEDNFVVYFVNNGSRQELLSAPATLSKGEWHIMKIAQRGNEFTGYLDGEKILAGSNNFFRNAGGVGLWTKADAITQFDDLVVMPLE